MSNKETIVHVTPRANYHLGLFKSKLCHLVFTDQQIMVVYRDPKKLKKVYEQYISEHEKGGKKANVFKKIGAKINSSNAFHLRYFEMTPQDMLLEDDNNFSIQPSDIQQLILKKGSVVMDEDGYETKNNDSLKMVVNGKKMKFSLTSDQFSKVANALDHILPEATYKKNKVILKR